MGDDLGRELWRGVLTIVGLAVAIALVIGGAIGFAVRWLMHR